MVEPRLTARLVQPTPPRDPMTAMTKDSTFGAISLPLRLSLLGRTRFSRCSALSSSSRTTGAVRNSRAPLRSAWTIASGADGQDGQIGRLGGQLADQLQGLGLI